MRSRVHQLFNQRNRKRSMIFILFALAVLLLGISYAAQTNSLYGEWGITTGKLGYGFVHHQRDDLSISLQCGTENNIRELTGKISIKDNKISISEISPIELEDFIHGNAVFTIHYQIDCEDPEEETLPAADSKGDTEKGTDLGSVCFQRDLSSLVWEVKAGTVCITPDVEMTSDGLNEVLRECLPEDLGEFHVYNKMIAENQTDLLKGTLILEQERTPASSETDRIKLSSLGFSGETIEQIKNGDSDITLDVDSAYCFVIPLALDQFNLNEKDCEAE